jgi:UPF0716 protein FxsA
MIAWLFLLFTVVPVVELYLLIKVGGLIGALPTIAIVLVTGAAGASLARWQGLAALQEIQRAMNEGRVPGQELLAGVLVLAGGLLLVTPGLITDVTGLLLLVPPVRRLVARGLAGYFRHRIEVHVGGFGVPPGFGPGGEGFGAGEEGAAAGRTVDAEYQAGAAGAEPGRTDADAPPSLHDGRQDP